MDSKRQQLGCTLGVIGPVTIIKLASFKNFFFLPFHGVMPTFPKWRPTLRVSYQTFHHHHYQPMLAAFSAYYILLDLNTLI